LTGDRFVVLGLAHVRSTWAIAVTRWATTGSLPVEFVKCVGADELRARLGTGRVFSAGLLDARLPAVDRDLVATLREHGVPSIIVDDSPTGSGRDWLALGAVAVVRGDLAREALLDALQEHGRIVDAVPSVPDLDGHDAEPSSAGWRGHLVVVTGRSGAGTSTIAAALAQRVADDPRQAGDVVLVDLCRRAHQALLHDARDVVPGVQELVEAHRTGRPSFEQVRALCFQVPDRRYRLVLGLRRATDWVTIRPRAFGAALDGLRRSTRLVVADVDADLDGEAETGSYDIEDRNLLARTTVAEADVVVAVATPTITGLHGLVSLLDDLRRFGVPGERTVVVLNRAPRNVRTRAELTRVVAALTGAEGRPDAHVGPVYVADRRGLDAVHRDLGRFPAAVADPPGAAVLAVLDRLGTRVVDVESLEPVPIRPGDLAHWADHDPGHDADDDLPDAEVGR
jgi:MinD-like ATPase involved in chromosome partitioning or flagellar assembly